MPLKKNGLQNVSSLTVCRHSDAFQYTLASLPMYARKVLFLVLAQISTPNCKPTAEELCFSITAKDFSNICNIGMKSAYRALEQGVLDLHKAVIVTSVSDRQRNSKSIITEANYFHQDGYCQLKMYRESFEYFFDLPKGYIKNYVLEVCQISDKNTLNFHQVLMKRYSKSDVHNEYKTGFIIPVNELKDEMNLFRYKSREKVYAYSEFAEFNRRLKLFAATLEKQSRFSDIKIAIAERRGRKVSHLKITYSHSVDSSRRELRELDAEERRLGLL